VRVVVGVNAGALNPIFELLFFVGEEGEEACLLLRFFLVEFCLLSVVRAELLRVHTLVCT